MTSRRFLVGTLLVLSTSFGAAVAQEITKFVVPFAAGGGTDVYVRLIAEEMTKRGQRVIVENKPGASGIIAADYVAKARPDGNTVLVSFLAILATNTVTFEKLPYDPQKDFAPVTQIAYQPTIVVARADVPYKNIKEMVAYAKANPNKINRGSPGAAVLKAGAMPRNWATLNNEEITTLMQQGRAAMTVNPYARLASYNDPGKSKFAGKLKPVNPPMAAALAGRMPYASTVEFWSLVMPKNSSRKRVAWDLLRAMSSKASTTSMALNGNGPTRVSSYADPRLRANNSFAKEEATALAGSRIHLPAFDEQARVHDIFVEESQAAVLGMKEPRQAMNDATRRARPLVHLST